MGRLIDADKLKDFIDDCGICAICPQKAPRCSYDCDFPEFVTEKWNVAIDAQPTIDAIPRDFHDKTCEAMAKSHFEELEKYRWIPCSERLPSEEEQDTNDLGVLVTLGNGYKGMDFDWYNDGRWYDWNGYVIAWMPLPKPYEETDHE